MTKLTWVAAKSGTWTTPGNWSPSQVPGAADDVLFDGSGADFSFVGTDIVNNLTLADSTTFLSVSGLLTVLDELIVNAGTLSIDTGATVALTDFTNQGRVIVGSGGSITAAGSYTTDSVKRIEGVGGTLRLLGTLDNVGNTLTLASVGPTIKEFGTMVGGTIVGQFVLDGAAAATFDGLTAQGGIAFEPGGQLSVKNGLAIRSADGGSPGIVAFKGGGAMTFLGDQILQDVRLDVGGGNSRIQVDGTLTLASTMSSSTVDLRDGRSTSRLTLDGNNTASAIVNHGSIALRPIYRPSEISVDVARFENRGTLSVLQAPARITIRSANFTNAVDGVVSAVNQVSKSDGIATIAVSATTVFTNDGSILANGGSVDLAPMLLGSGDVLITSGGTVDLHSGADSAQTVIFGDNGVLELESAPLFAGTITGLTKNTSIRLNVSATALAYTNDVLTMQLSGGQTFGLHIVGDNLTLDDFIFNTSSLTTAISTNVASPPCFVTGTRIWTDTGEVPVETLQIGDRVRLASGAEPKPIVWIGQRHVSCATHPNPRQVWPVRIAANAFAPDQPARDLFLSPDHALFIDDVLIPVKHLINDQTITQVPTETVTYYHVELASHDVILAEGLPVESYLDTGDRTSFANAAIVTTLFPTFGPQGDPNQTREAHAIAPLVVAGPIIQAVRQRLAPNTNDLVTAEAEPRRLTRRQSPHRRTPLKQPQQHPHRTPAV